MRLLANQVARYLKASKSLLGAKLILAVAGYSQVQE